MTRRAHTIVKSARGEHAIRLVVNEPRDESLLKPVRFPMTNWGILGRVAIVICLFAFVTAHAWGIYKVETARHARFPVKETPVTFSE